MDISKNDVKKMAMLARLNVDDVKAELLAQQYVDIIKYMQVLQSVNTDNIEPLCSPSCHEWAVREDIVKSHSNSTETLSNSPSSDGIYFVVPSII